jgi:predicted RNA-binding protein associated with RNAse of E/G family
MIMVLEPGREVAVSLVKAGREKLRYQAAVLADDGTHIVVRAPYAGDEPHDLGYTVFDLGDVFTEHYWRDRWYSVKEIRGEQAGLKGWYCDVARPVRVRDGLLASEDLDLDLWVSADRRTVLRLDRDDFDASGLAERDPDAVREALRAFDELERLASDGFTEIAWDADGRSRVS